MSARSGELIEIRHPEITLPQTELIRINNWNGTFEVSSMQRSRRENEVYVDYIKSNNHPPTHNIRHRFIISLDFNGLLLWKYKYIYG